MPSPRSSSRRAFDHVVGRRRRLGDAQPAEARVARVTPLTVGRHGEGRDSARLAPRRGDRLAHVPAERSGGAALAKPIRDRPRQRLDVGGERRVVTAVPGGVVADQVDDRATAALGVVQIRNRVAVTRAEVKEGQRRLLGHAAVAVRGAARDSLEQHQDAAQPGLGIEGGHQRHLAGAGVGETDLDPGGPGGANQTLGSVHRLPLLSRSAARIRPGAEFRARENILDAPLSINLYAQLVSSAIVRIELSIWARNLTPRIDILRHLPPRRLGRLPSLRDVRSGIGVGADRALGVGGRLELQDPALIRSKTGSGCAGGRSRQ